MKLLIESLKNILQRSRQKGLRSICVKVQKHEYDVVLKNEPNRHDQGGKWIVSWYHSRDGSCLG